MFHKNQLDRCVEDMPLNDVALYHLINIGARDMDTTDKLWDASTCSMRYATCLTGGKGPNNQWAHAEYIENPVNK